MANLHDMPMRTGWQAHGACTYAIGDLHGEVTVLKRLLETLAAEDTLIVLGDYVDRGEDPQATVEFLTTLSARHWFVSLRSHHDTAWLGQWNGERFKRCPAIRGAGAIWEQYCGKVLPLVPAFCQEAPHGRSHDD